MRGGLRFWKMEGAGNDFVLVDGRRGAVPGDPSRLARILCDRRRGVGADGLLVVREAGEDRVRVGYWNADGSGASFCGNGARCVALLSVREGWSGTPLEVSFPGLAARAEVAVGEGLVSLELPAPEPLGELVLDGGDLRFPASVWRVGVVHVLVAVPGHDPGRIPLSRVAAVAEEATGFPDPNVTLVAGSGPRVRIRTRERGAGETPACGSAALAAGAWRGDRGRPVVVETSGGSPLSVRVEGDGTALLSGPARIAFSGTWAPFPA